jgi:putative membrane protein
LFRSECQENKRWRAVATDANLELRRNSEARQAPGVSSSTDPQVKEGNMISMMKILLSLFSIMFVCAVFPSCVVQGVLSRSEADFVKAAAEDALFQIKLGKLAQVKSAEVKVKYFGQSVVDTYSKAYEGLRVLAQQNNVELPQQMSQESQKLYDELSRLKSDDFDVAYADLMVEAHTVTVMAYERELYPVIAIDPALSQWISKTLPTLRSNLQKAKEIADVLSGGTVQ